MDIQKVFNANVYDGTSSLLGKALEVTLPDIVPKLVEHQGMGMIAPVELPTGSIEKMEAKIKWGGFYAEVYTSGGDHYTHRKLQIRASVEVHNAEGLAGQKPLVILMTARFKKAPGGVYGAAKDVELESDLSVTYLKIKLDGVDLLEIDAMNNVYKVNGVDKLAQYRANIGG